MAAEVQNNAITNNYLRGVNLIRREATNETEYYLFNAHGDVVTTTNPNGTVNQSYDYDAFGVEKDPDTLDSNPFRYCGEYLDAETGSYYLRARYYEPTLGRFTQQDTHWNTANMIYGDNPQEINEREDKLGLKTYSYAPQITAVMQSGNLYIYCINSPCAHIDPEGNSVIVAALTSATLSGIISGSIAKMNGEKFLAGFAAGFCGAIGTAIGVAIGPIGTVVGSAIGSAVGSLIHDIIQGGISDSEITANAVKAFMYGSLAGTSAAFWEYAVKIAKEADSVAQLLMKYDTRFGELIKEFFSQLVCAISTELRYEL